MILLWRHPQRGPWRWRSRGGKAGGPALGSQPRQVDDWTLELDLAGDSMVGTLSGPGGPGTVGDFAGSMSACRSPGPTDLGDPPIPSVGPAQALYQALLAWLRWRPARRQPLARAPRTCQCPTGARISIVACRAATTVTNDHRRVLRFATEHWQVIYNRPPRRARSFASWSEPGSRTWSGTSPADSFQPYSASTSRPRRRRCVHATEVISARTTTATRSRREGVGCGPSRSPPISRHAAGRSALLELPLCGIDLRRTPRALVLLRGHRSAYLITRSSPDSRSASACLVPERGAGAATEVATARCER